MKVLFDTSALIPALVQSLAGHSAALQWLEKAQRKEIQGFVSAHTLAELYGGLTGFGKKRPVDVRRVIEVEIRAYLEVVALDAEEYACMLDDAARLNVKGATVHDAVHAYAARKVGADQILTGNIRHFALVCPTPPPVILDVFGLGTP